MKTEKNRLQTRIKELEQQLNNQQFNENERKLKERELDANRQLLAEKDRELDKLRKQQPNKPTNTENNNSKLNWAIGLGIVALVVGFLCFILLLRKKKN